MHGLDARTRDQLYPKEIVLTLTLAQQVPHSYGLQRECAVAGSSLQLICIIAMLAALGYCTGSLVAACLTGLNPRAVLSRKARARLRQLVDARLQRKSGLQLCRREGA